MNRALSIQILLLISALIIALHLSILAGWIPYEYTWGGRLKTVQEMYVFESVSIIVNLLLILSLLAKGPYPPFKRTQRWVNIVLWVFFILFLLNTVGNLVAKTTFEKWFALVTLLLAGLIGNLLFRRTKE
jgi:hypothetical protein